MFGLDTAALTALGSFAGSGLEAGGGLLSSIMGNQTSQQNAQNQFYYNLALQQSQQAYQTQMSNTQYQRSVADMKAAGLNPMLAAGGGMSLDSAPGGGSASVSQAQTVTPNFSGIASSALQGAKLLKELEKVDSSVKLDLAHAKKAENDTLAPGQAPMVAEAARRRDQAIAGQADASSGATKAQQAGETGDVGVLGIHAPLQAVRRGVSEGVSAAHGAAKYIHNNAPALYDNPITTFGHGVGAGIRKFLGADNRSPSSPEVGSTAKTQKMVNPNSLRGRAMTYPSYYTNQ